MATQTVAATGGNWSSSATWSPGSIPAAGDDVILNAASGQLTIDVNTNTIRSIVCTGYTNTITHNAAVTLNIGGASAPVGNIALLFVATETYTLGSATTSAIAIADTSGATNTYNFAGLTTGNVTINNGTTTTTQLLTSGFNTGATATVTLTQGKFDTNGQTCSWGLFSSSNSNTRTLSFGNSNITITQSSVDSWNVGTVAGLTFNAGTSTLTIAGNNVTFTSGNITYNNIVYTGGLGPNGMTGPLTINNLTVTGTASQNNLFTFSVPNSTITITGTLTINGNSSINRILIRSYSNNNLGIPVTINSANNVFSNVDFMDIIATGSGNWNLSGISGGSGDCGNNQGITFTPAVTQTWQGATGGNWSANLWTTRIPLPQDNVNISEEFQSGQTVVCDVPRLGKNLSFVGITGSPTINFSTSLFLFGSLTLNQGLSFSGSNPLYFQGRGTYTITNAGNQFPNNMVIDCGKTTNSYTLNDGFSTNGTLFFNGGTFNAGTQNVVARAFSSAAGILSGQGFSSGTRAISMGSGNWTLFNPATNSTVWNFSTTTNVTLNSQTSTINLSNPTSSEYTFAGGGFTYNNVNLNLINGSEGDFLITGNNTFNNFTINSPNTIRFTNGSTTTCNFFTANGSTSGAIVLRSTVNNYAWNLNVLAGYSVSNTDIRDSNAAGSRIQP